MSRINDLLQKIYSVVGKARLDVFEEAVTNVFIFFPNGYGAKIIYDSETDKYGICQMKVVKGNDKDLYTLPYTRLDEDLSGYIDLDDIPEYLEEIKSFKSLMDLGF